MTEEECTEVPSQDKSAGIDTSNNDVGAVEAVTEHSKEASNHVCDPRGGFGFAFPSLKGVLS